MKCVQCESQRIVSDISVMDTGTHNINLGLRVFHQKDPDAFIMKGTTLAAVTAHACADCGFLMLKAPVEWLQEVEKHHTS